MEAYPPPGMEQAAQPDDGAAARKGAAGGGKGKDGTPQAQGVVEPPSAIAADAGGAVSPGRTGVRGPSAVAEEEDERAGVARAVSEDEYIASETGRGAVREYARGSGTSLEEAEKKIREYARIARENAIRRSRGPEYADLRRQKYARKAADEAATYMDVVFDPHGYYARYGRDKVRQMIADGEMEETVTPWRRIV